MLTTKHHNDGGKNSILIAYAYTDARRFAQQLTITYHIIVI